VTHYNPVLLTVLPKERRARHPYQLCVMAMLATLAASQLVFGPPQGSSTALLDPDTQALLNWMCLACGIGGVMAAFIPETIVKIGWVKFDATWARLWIELAAHAVLFFIWLSFCVIISLAFPFTDGLTLGSAAAFWLAAASLWRAGQIWVTIKRAVFDPPIQSGITGVDSLRKKQAKGG
jgi:hypothetical protein